MTVTESEVLVKTTSKAYKDREERYRLVGKDTFARYAVAEIKVSYDTISLPADPSIDLKKNGFFNATISTQSNFYVNSWLLRCVE